MEVRLAPAILFTRGVGSCVVVVLHNIPAGMGALAHIDNPNGKGACVTRLVSQMDYVGSVRLFSTAGIIGGGNMFPNEGPPLCDIGPQILTSVRHDLKKLGIEITYENVMGNGSKSVWFDLGTGLIKIRNFGD